MQWHDLYLFIALNYSSLFGFIPKVGVAETWNFFCPQWETLWILPLRLSNLSFIMGDAQNNYIFLFVPACNASQNIV